MGEWWRRVRGRLDGADRWIDQRCGHRVTAPGRREVAIAFWRRCAGVWCAQRFGALEGWKPAHRHSGGPGAIVIRPEQWRRE